MELCDSLRSCDDGRAAQGGGVRGAVPAAAAHTAFWVVATHSFHSVIMGDSLLIRQILLREEGAQQTPPRSAPFYGWILMLLNTDTQY